MHVIIRVVLCAMFLGAFFRAPFVSAEKYHQVPYEKYVSQIDELVERSTTKKKNIPLPIVGGIAPHHVPTSFPLIVDFYAQIKNKKNIKTIVVLGPDHFNKNSVDIAVSQNKFVTPYGSIDPDRAIIEKLTKTGLVSRDEEPFEKEHSILSHAIVIKKVFPNAKLVPLVFRASTTFEKAKKLGEYLAAIFDDSTLVVVSVDFSHYLPLKEARARDEKSLVFVRKAEPDSLPFIDVDSPTALATLFSYCKKKGVCKGIDFSTWNMADFENVTDNTTGYITGYFSAFRKAKSEMQKNSSFVIPHLMRDSVFKPKLSGNSESVTLLFAGDIMLSRSIEMIMKKKKDFTYHTRHVKEFMRSADLTIANFENPIRGTKDIKKGEMVFGADPKSIKTLTELGVDVVSLANNHMFDQTGSGITRTIDTLNTSSIDGVGAGHTYNDAHTPVIKEIKGVKIAFLAYTPFLPQYIKKKSSQPAVSDMNEKEITRDVNAAKKIADVVVTMFHWGDEYKTTHNKKQEIIAHAAIDAGASLVIGHHPHVIQDIKTYKDTPIIYSLGNFIFDQNFSKDTKRGLVAEIKINQDKTISIVPHEVRFTKDFQPYFVE